MTIPCTIKLPAGLTIGAEVVSNDQYAIINKRAPRNRKGKITAGTAKPGIVRVLWDGCTYHHEVDVKLFDLAENATVMPTPKMRVTWRADRRRWQVWEEYPDRSAHHSFHRTHSEATRAARAQASQDKKDERRHAHG